MEYEPEKFHCSLTLDEIPLTLDMDGTVMQHIGQSVSVLQYAAHIKGVSGGLEAVVSIGLAAISLLGIAISSPDWEDH